MTTVGCEWIVDAHGCDPVLVADLDAMRSLFAAIIDELQLTPIGDVVWHVFPAPGGITGLVPLAESHLTVHTFPEHESVCINLFCCKPRAEWPWGERLIQYVGAKHVHVRGFERRYEQVSEETQRSVLAPST